MKLYSKSIKGRKEINEDAILTQELGDGRFICLLADGMGGYAQGDIAAKIVCENILALVASSKIIDERLMQIAVNKSNLALRQREELTGIKSGATLGGIFIENNTALCFWIGDVRIFHFEKSNLIFESRAQNLINNLVDRGLIVDSDRLSAYKHIVTNSIQGDKENPKLSFKSIEINSKNDYFIMVTDGFPIESYILVDVNEIKSGLENDSRFLHNGDDATVIIIEDVFMHGSNKT